MRRPARYHTKQREAILSYLSSLDGAHVTAGRIAQHFKERGIGAGLTTIYRHLDKLVQEGVVKKYTLDGTRGACYQYIEADAPAGPYHLKCEVCGAVVHLQCTYIEELSQHFIDNHLLSLNPRKTLFYGRCSRCLSQ